MISNLMKLPAVLAAVGTISGCAATVVDENGLVQPNVGSAALPSRVKPYAEIEQTLACIRDSGAIRGKVFVVGAFADSTGKINASAIGATGNFIPQGGSSSYVTDALRKAGGEVISTYFGPPEVRTRAHYAMNGIFNSLDFGRPFDVDMRFNGVGPIISNGWAQVSLTIQMDDARTRRNHQISMVQRPVRYQSVGLGVGREFDGNLVTGTASGINQERLQLEAINGPIALGVADALVKEFPAARSQCGSTVNRLMNGTPPSESG